MTGLGVARLFRLRLRYGFVVPAVRRDTYRDGKGRMLIRLFDLFTIADGRSDAHDTRAGSPPFSMTR